MAKIKFNLNFGGEEIRTLDDLRENLSIEDVLDNYNNGTLARWLDSRSYNNELEQVKAIQATDARGIFAELIHILGVSSDPADIEEGLSLVDYIEERKKFGEERRSLALLERELEEVKRERDALKQELENAKRGQDVQQEQNVLKQRRDAIKQNHAIKYKIPAQMLRNGAWKRIASRGKSYRIIDQGNADLMIVADDEGNNTQTIQEAVRQKTRFDGLKFMPDIDSCHLNERKPIYFFYAYVR